MARDEDQLLTTIAEHLARRPTASMDQVARSAGISRATLHRQFANRDVLVRRLEQLALRRLGSVLETARIDEGPADQAVRRVVDQVQPHASLLAFLFTENQLFEPEAVHQGWQALDDRFVELFRRGQHEGVFRVDLTAVWLTEALYALVTGCAWAVLEGRVAGRDAQWMVTTLLLDGARREPAREVRR
ncbi:TetR/AcrR family transcriptional regulator [Streptomyces sp. NPDC005438]|uniref:TetR/AcrR family transcriptional regulator n=1 Tax=Streptomyces sp. NPDC005438 TaxID=3156880 RepID=UPI0033AE4BCF